MGHIVFRKQIDGFFEMTSISSNMIRVSAIRDVQIVDKFAYVFSLSRELIGKHPVYLVNIVR